MADTKKKKYSQEDVEEMLWKFYLSEKESSQRDKMCSLLEEHDVYDLAKTNEKLRDFYSLSEEHKKYVEAVKWLRENYNLDVR